MRRSVVNRVPACLLVSVRLRVSVCLSVSLYVVSLYQLISLQRQRRSQRRLAPFSPADNARSFSQILSFLRHVYCPICLLTTASSPFLSHDAILARCMLSPCAWRLSVRPFQAGRPTLATSARRQAPCDQQRAINALHVHHTATNVSGSI